MAHHFHAARWQNYPARRVGPAHLSRIIRATVGEDHPDYRDLEARRRQGVEKLWPLETKARVPGSL